MTYFASETHGIEVVLGMIKFSSVTAILFYALSIALKFYILSGYCKRRTPCNVHSPYKYRIAKCFGK